jgi:hypothetical protein
MGWLLRRKGAAVAVAFTAAGVAATFLAHTPPAPPGAGCISAGRRAAFPGLLFGGIPVPRADDERRGDPSYRVLARAIKANRRAGHENLGFLSVAHGLMPTAEPSLRLAGTHRVWDDLAGELPELYGRLAVRPRVVARYCRHTAGVLRTAKTAGRSR